MHVAVAQCSSVGFEEYWAHLLTANDMPGLVNRAQ